MHSQSARVKGANQNEFRKQNLPTTARSAEASVYGKKNVTSGVGVKGSTQSSNATTYRIQGGQIKSVPANSRNPTKAVPSPLYSNPKNYISSRALGSTGAQVKDSKLPPRKPVNTTLPTLIKNPPKTQRPTSELFSQQRKPIGANQGGRPSEARILPYNSSAYATNRKTDSTVKTVVPAIPKSVKPEEQKSKIWNRNYSRTPRVPPIKTVKDTKASDTEVKKKKNMIEISIQANELEIMNPDIIIGDMKILLPSPELIRLIEQDRYQKRLLKLLKAERKFEPHALQEKEHLTDLKEFLERAAIKKRPRIRKTVDELEEDRRMIASMDEVFKHPLPKTESLSNITQRIKRKEAELLQMFEGFNKLKIPGLRNQSEY